MHRTIPVALLLLAACATDGVSEREAQDTFDAVNTVADELVSSAVRSVEGTGGMFTVQATGGDLALEGVVTDGEGWTGTITIVGAVRTGVDPVGYELLVEFDRVSPVGGDVDVVLDGELTLAFTFDYDLGAEVALEAAVAVDGDLALSGGEQGRAVLDYDLQLSVRGFDVSFTASGQISGHDVSAWPFGLSIPL